MPTSAAPAAQPFHVNPLVVDISHHNTVKSFAQAKAFGIRGVIHKASEGASVPDKEYAPRREAALKEGLLWGAYHFNTGAPVADQVHNFLTQAKPDATTLMVLDYEDNPTGNMNLKQARDFMERLDQAIGRPCAIYSGNRLKEAIVHADDDTLAFFAKHRLWLCQYGPKAVLPRGFEKYWLWQYTGDGVGAFEPKNIPGIVAGIKGLDVNHWPGTPEQLAAQWAAG